MGQLHNSLPANQLKVHLRCVRPSDNQAVQRLYSDGVLIGPWSPNQVALREQLFEHKSYLAYTVIGVGTLLAAFAPSGPHHAWYRIGGILTALAAIGLILFYRRKITEGYKFFVDNSVLDDLGDVVKHYRIKEVIDAKGEQHWSFGGASAFWVVETADEWDEASDLESSKRVVGRDSELGQKKGARAPKVVACVGLDVAEGEKVGAVRRMIVSPSFQGRGIGKMLLKATFSHAHAHGLKALKLSSTLHQPPAIHLYEKAGWYVVGKTSVGGWWFKVKLLHFNNELSDSKEADARENPKER